MKKKILIVTDSFLPRWDGVTRFLSEVISLLVNDFDVTVIAPDFIGSGEVKMENVTIVRMPLTRFSVNDYPFARFSKKINTYVQDADIIWTQDISTLCLSAIYYAKKNNKILISYNHVVEWDIISASVKSRILAGVLRSIFRLFTKWIYNKFDLLMIPDREQKSYYESIGIKTFSKVVPLGVNTQRFLPAVDKFTSKKNIGIDPEYIVIGYCGRLGREKNILTLYKAFELMQQRIPKIKLLLIGKGIKEFEDQLHSKHNVILTGELDNVIPYLQAMDIFVLPSLTETTSLSTLEAMSCGLPVICTPVGKIKSIIINGENGLIFPKQNVMVLRKKLEWLTQKEDIRLTLGVKARETVISGFSWESTSRVIGEIFKQF